MSSIDYGDIHSGHSRRKQFVAPEVPAEMGLVVEDRASEFCGAVVGFEKAYDGTYVRLEGPKKVTRVFAMRKAAFAIDGQAVTLVKPATPITHQRGKRSASGSVHVGPTRARVAKASRIWVEGVHDAALVERVWGHDLRVEGVVVEQLEGLDHLVDRLMDFQPGPGRRVGVLADHLVSGSKESNIASSLACIGFGEHVMVTGHPYVDIWEAVKPSALGIDCWPRVPRGRDWKTGVCSELCWGTPQDGFRRVLSAVSSYRDIEADLIGAVERLIDFVATDNP